MFGRLKKYEQLEGMNSFFEYVDFLTISPIGGGNEIVQSVRCIIMKVTKDFI